MTTHDFEAHPRWNWRPPDWMNASMRFFVRTPVLHRMVSGGIVLIAFTGRKSGKPYRIPTMYARDDDHVLVIVKGFRTWWRNFEGGRDATLTLRGQAVPARGEAITDPAESAPLLKTFFTIRRRDAMYYGMETDGGVPDESALAALAEKVTVLRFTVSSN